MQRITIAPRKGWIESVEAYGFDFHTIEGFPYWDESAYWKFTSDQIDEIDSATEELHKMCLEAVQYVIDNRHLPLMGITGHAAELVKASWAAREPHLYGRFDLAYTGSGAPKMLEYNADTPTSIFEASIIQWAWLESRFPDSDQFNSLHEKLVDRFKVFKLLHRHSDTFHFACVAPHEEDEGTLRYLQAAAIEAGFKVKFVPIADVGWNGVAFTDNEDHVMSRLFKLYPWEWLTSEEFSQNVSVGGSTMWVEPPWKMVLSNKAILAVLWEMYPHHPNLLKASFSPKDFGSTYVKKALLGREGRNVTIVKNGDEVQSVSGDYGSSGFVYQELAELAQYEGGHAVVGSWVIGDVTAGMGIREDTGLITENTGRFVPHLFE